MAQNIYDDPGFFRAYSQLRRSTEGLAGAPEWPALRAMLPNLRGRSVVDLGCGYGWFCRWARAQGATRVLGLDLSENMLARAEAMTSDVAVTYRRADLEKLELPVSSFDLAWSSLTFHYVVDLAGLLAIVQDALTPGGDLVLSMEHPIFMAPSRPSWLVDAEGRRIWPLDSYAIEGERRTDWLARGVVKQHRTLATIVNLLIGAGFELARLQEWAPSEDQVRQDPSLAEEQDRPMFLLLAARKGSRSP